MRQFYHRPSSTGERIRKPNMLIYLRGEVLGGDFGRGRTFRRSLCLVSGGRSAAATAAFDRDASFPLSITHPLLLLSARQLAATAQQSRAEQQQQLTVQVCDFKSASWEAPCGRRGGRVLFDLSTRPDPTRPVPH
ncbi:uncharacterized protein [Physcomitrium patens]|uniref:uncharacterized protein n=1 Tax=Physcomitrium patens TaxID=3218 RepID=UPI003CCDE543